MDTIKELYNIDIKENYIRNLDAALLAILIKDKSSGKNIIWATDTYKHRGVGYQPQDYITAEAITGIGGNIVKPRTEKSKKEQRQRIKNKAEVFTPSWICNKQNNLVDSAWFGRENVFNVENDAEKSWTTNAVKIIFPDGKTWQDYVSENRMEITCGEAPYLTSRYDTVTGEAIDIKNRIGLLDRKLRIISENVDDEQEWYYLQSRYYDPEICRFISADNLELLPTLSKTAGQLNLYAYCNNNPVMYSDPSGEFWDTVFDLLFLGWDIYDLCTNNGWQDWKKWLALGADVLFTTLPFVSGGGQVVKVGNHVDDPYEVAKLINDVDNFQDMSKVTMIGRNMDRVKDTASLIGKADNLYVPWKGYDKAAKGIKGFFHNAFSAMHDGAWMFGKLRSGYTVIDIGLSTAYRGWGLYYGAERTVMLIWQTRNIWKLGYHI